MFLFLIILIPMNCYAKMDTSKSSIVMDIDSGRVLYKNNINEKRLIASTTKIMTAVVALENGKLTDVYTAKDEILKMYGTSIYLEYNEKMKLKDLLYGLLLRSGNDAAVVIANNISKNEDEFVKLMNKKARDIGMDNTIFKNSHGLNEKTKNYSTAYDMALLSSYAYKNRMYRSISKTKEYETNTKNKSYLWINRNKLLKTYEYCTGGKNGYTPKAGRTLVTTASKNNISLTIVTLGDNNEYVTHKNLYEYIFNNYTKFKIVDKNNFYINKTFFKDKLYLKNSFYYLLKNDEVKYIKTVVKINKTKRYRNNDKVGYITIYFKNKEIGKVYIYVKTN